MTLYTGILIVGYFIFFLACVVAMLWWMRRQRQVRHPLDNDLRLLRMPGETQFKIITEFQENLFLYMVTAAYVPVFVGVLALVVFTRLPGWGAVAGLGVSVGFFIVAFILSARWLNRRIIERSNRYLGYFGERVVAEHLEPLELKGWRIFHDVPATAGRASFNIDHVAIGPSGIFAIETKTRRKGRSRPGRKDYEVWFDGISLSWPWGEDRHGIEQARRNAQWLEEKLGAVTGEAPRVEPVLTVPGWMVIEKTRSPLRVVNPKVLAPVLTSRRPLLTEQQVERYARFLEERCRNVEY